MDYWIAWINGAGFVTATAGATMLYFIHVSSV
jgi:hypothetical protein